MNGRTGANSMTLDVSYNIVKRNRPDFWTTG